MLFPFCTLKLFFLHFLACMTSHEKFTIFVIVQYVCIFVIVQYVCIFSLTTVLSNDDDNGDNTMMTCCGVFSLSFSCLRFIELLGICGFTVFNNCTFSSHYSFKYLSIFPIPTLSFRDSNDTYTCSGPYEWSCFKAHRHSQFFLDTFYCYLLKFINLHSGS